MSDVAGPARTHHVRDLDAAGLLKGLHELKHTRAVSSAEIENLETLQLFFVEGSRVTLCKVHHMDVVTHTSAIRLCRVVVAENCQLLELA